MDLRACSLFPVVVLLSSAVARAQAHPYGATLEPGDAPARDWNGDLAFATTYPADPLDSGGAHVVLPEGFVFRFFDADYTEFDVLADGAILFDNDANGLIPKCGTANSPYCANTLPRTIPAATSGDRPNNLIAFWWGDMVFAPMPERAQWAVSGTAPNRVFSIRFQHWAYYPRGYLAPRTVQVELTEKPSSSSTENGTIRIYYGPLPYQEGEPVPWNGASVGIEGRPNVSGRPDGLPGLECTNRVTGARARCRNSHWPSGKVLTFAPSTKPDLLIESIVIKDLNTIEMPGDQRVFETVLEVTVANRGSEAAAGVTFDVYPPAVPLAPPDPSSFLARFDPPFSLEGKAKSTHSVAIRFPRTESTHTLAFTARVDPEGIIDESNEANNLYWPLLSEVLVEGLDLEVSSLSATAAAFGEEAPVSVTVTSRGLERTPQTTGELWLSRSAQLDFSAYPPPALLATRTLPPIPAAGRFEDSFTARIRPDVPGYAPGPNYLVFRVQLPAGLPEVDKQNNSRALPLDLEPDCPEGKGCDSSEVCFQEICVPLFDLGMACTKNAECQSGYCADGFCCEEACDGQCEVCEQFTGRCVAALGAPQGTRAPCAGDGTVCRGYCNGIDREACVYPDAQTECAPPICKKGVEYGLAHCDGAGYCQQGETRECGAYACLETRCALTCASDGDCAEPNVCRNNECVSPTDEQAKSESGCGCGTTAGGGSGWVWIGLALVASRMRVKRVPSP